MNVQFQRRVNLFLMVLIFWGFYIVRCKRQWRSFHTFPFHLWHSSSTNFTQDCTVATPIWRLSTWISYRASCPMLISLKYIIFVIVVRPRYCTFELIFFSSYPMWSLKIYGIIIIGCQNQSSIINFIVVLINLESALGIFKNADLLLKYPKMENRKGPFIID